MADTNVLTDDGAPRVVTSQRDGYVRVRLIPAAPRHANARIDRA